MKTLKQLFLIGILATFSLGACDLLEGLVDPDTQDKISETLIKQHIQGTWEITHVSGFVEQWNDKTQKHEIVPIDRDIQITPNGEWCHRTKFTASKAIYYDYREYGWVETGQSNYTVEGDKIVVIWEENGQQERWEMKVISIANDKFVISMPLESDPSKATIVTTKRVDDEQGDGVSETLIKQHIQGTWEVTHISGYVEQWNDRTQKEEIVPIDRDAHPSPEDHWCFRAKFTADQMTYYAYMQYGWTPTEQHNYTVEGDKIVVIFSENGQQERWETKVLHIDNDNLVFAMPLWSDPSKATIITTKRVEDVPVSEVSEALIRQHIQGTWEVTHISGYVEEWNDRTQQHEIIPIDRDAHPSPEDHWCFRAKFTADQMTYYAYMQYGWTPTEQHNYTVEGNKIVVIFSENGHQERWETKVLHIDNDNLVFAMPLWSDPSKETIIITKRVEDVPVSEVTEALIRQHIQGTWEVTHISGYVEEWNDRTQQHEIIPIDRAAHPSPEDHWCFRAKFTADQMTYYAYMQYGWTPTEQHNYTVEGNKIVVIFSENGHQERWETKVLHIDNDNLVFAMPVWSDPSKETIIITKRVSDEQGGGVSESLIRGHIQGTWEVTHVSGYEERWNENLQKYEIFPIDRDVNISPYDYWSRRTKFTADKAIYYQYMEHGWLEAGQSNYTVEGDRIVVIWEEDGYQDRIDIRVFYIDNEKVVIAIPINDDPSMATIVTAKRVEDEPDSEVTEALIKQHIQGTWEITHVSGYVEQWNDYLQRVEIFPIDQDVQITPNGEWCHRTKFTADKAIYYQYTEHGWIEAGQNNYTVEGNSIVVIWEEDGHQERWEMKVLYIDNEKVVIAMPLQSDPSKATILTTKRVE